MKKLSVKGYKVEDNKYKIGIFDLKNNLIYEEATIYDITQQELIRNKIKEYELMINNNKGNYIKNNKHKIVLIILSILISITVIFTSLGGLIISIIKKGVKDYPKNKTTIIEEEEKKELNESFGIATIGKIINNKPNISLINHSTIEQSNHISSKVKKLERKYFTNN